MGHQQAVIGQLAGLSPLPWQELALLTAGERNGARWAHQEVGIIAARQNGKTGLLTARAGWGLFVNGERIIHSAQNLSLPREVFGQLVRLAEGPFSRVTVDVKRANGKEAIYTRAGGSYRVIASRQDAPRGLSADLVILDELREQRDFAFLGAVRPTLATSSDPQLWYASNAGDAGSVVLNELRERGHRGADGLCWLEWSASPELARDDPQAWAQANPSMGYLISPEHIASELRAMEPDAFDTERLCRWLTSKGAYAFPPAAWAHCYRADIPEPVAGSQRVLGISLTPDRTAAAAVLAWSQEGPLGASERVAADLVAYLEGPDAPDQLEAACVALVKTWAPQLLAYDPWSGGTTAQGVTALTGIPLQAVTGREWVAACGETYDRLRVQSLHHPGREQLSAQMIAATRKTNSEGRWWVIENPEAPTPAALALIRAVYLAGTPRALPEIA